MKANDRTREIDNAARIIARREMTNTDRTNPEAKWGDMVISATFGAGTNSTSVMHGTTILYQAHDYGRIVETLREGAWCKRLVDHAAELREQEQKEKEKQRQKEEAEEAARFAPIDF